MNITTYHTLIERLENFYSPHGINLYRRNGVLYPFIVESVRLEHVNDLLASQTPHDLITRDELPIYNEAVLTQIQQSGRRVYNGQTFAFDRLDLNPPQLHARLGTYFDHLATCFALEDELLHGETNLRQKMHANLPPEDVMRFGWGRSAAIGVNTLIVARSGAGYVALFSQRSAHTALRPGEFHVIPAFTFQPLDEDDRATSWDLEAQILREYVEELFDAPEAEHGGDISGHPHYLELNAMLADGRASLEPTGMMINLITTHVSVGALLLIHDPEWVTNRVGQLRTGWETQRLLQLPIETDNALLAALPDDAYVQMSPNGAATLWLGVDRARESVG